jgi:hypothetical protein
MLARRDGGFEGWRPFWGDLGIEVDLVLGAGEAGFQVGGPVFETVRIRQGAQPVSASADQDRLGPDDLAVTDRDAALLADCQDRAQQMLVGAHAPSDAVHDDPEPHGRLRLTLASPLIRHLRRCCTKCGICCPRAEDRAERGATRIPTILEAAGVGPYGKQSRNGLSVTVEHHAVGVHRETAERERYGRLHFQHVVRRPLRGLQG